MSVVGVLLGLLGLVPFVICGLGAISADPVRAALMLAALVGYAAVVLGFSGGIHWGLVLREPQSEVPLQGTRLGLAVVPMLIGWLALILDALAAGWPALVLLIAGYIATIVLEHHGSQRGVLPNRYVWLRWAFTIVAVAMLITVTTMRLLGQTIAF